MASWRGQSPGLARRHRLSSPPWPSPKPHLPRPGPTLDVAVVMRRERLHGPSSHWQPWRWTLDSVVPDEPGFGTEPRLLRDDDERAALAASRLQGRAVPRRGRGLPPQRDHAGAPCWFVLWRMDEEATLAPEPIPRPVVVSAELQRGRPLARCAGERRAGAGAAPRWSRGCAPSSTSTTWSSPSAASGPRASGRWSTASAMRRACRPRRSAAGERAMSEGFFERWSRRKQVVREGEVLPPEPVGRRRRSCETPEPPIPTFPRRRQGASRRRRRWPIPRRSPSTPTSSPSSRRTSRPRSRTPRSRSSSPIRTST